MSTSSKCHQETSRCESPSLPDALLLGAVLMATHTALALRGRRAGKGAPGPGLSAAGETGHPPAPLRGRGRGGAADASPGASTGYRPHDEDTAEPAHWCGAIGVER